MFLPDINVLLAMVFEAHSHHVTARTWFENREESSCKLCRITQAGFLRLASNPALFGAETLTLSQAWACYDALIEDVRIEFVREPLGLDHLWRKMTMSDSYSPKVWTDSYLAAFAKASGFRLITFDRGFITYADLEYELLSPQ